jgi:hypothetical protein
MSTPIIGGIIQVKVNGQLYSARGDFTWNPGVEKRDAVMGTSEVAGWSTKPQVPFIEGEFTDRGDMDMVALRKVKDATVYLDLANGRAFVLRDACFAGEGSEHTEEGNMDVRFEGLSGEVV